MKGRFSLFLYLTLVATLILWRTVPDLAAPVAIIGMFTQSIVSFFYDESRRDRGNK